MKNRFGRAFEQHRSGAVIFRNLAVAVNGHEGDGHGFKQRFDEHMLLRDRFVKQRIVENGAGLIGNKGQLIPIGIGKWATASMRT